MTEQDLLIQVAEILVPIGVGWLGKVAHGKIMDRLNAFADFVDGVKAIANGKTAPTSEALNALVTDAEEFL